MLTLDELEVQRRELVRLLSHTDGEIEYERMLRAALLNVLGRMSILISKERELLLITGV